MPSPHKALCAPLLAVFPCPSARFLAGVDERVSEVRGQEGGAQARAVDRYVYFNDAMTFGPYCK